MSDASNACARGRPTARAQSDMPQRNLDESPLAWLARRKDKDGRPMIATVEFDAGERLRADFWFAQMTPRVTANWSLLQTGGGGRRTAPALWPEVPEQGRAARQRWQRALAAVGPDLAGVLIDVCCHLKGLEQSEKASGWPQRSGKIILTIALRQLARHYGLLHQGPAPGSSGRLQHWGASDYRPRVTPDTAEPAPPE